MRILFTGGGTGGHLFPIVAVIRQLKRIHQPVQSLEMFFLGPDGFSKTILEKEGVKTKIILAGKLRRYFSISNFLDLFKMPLGLLQAFFYLFLWMPDVIFSKGGYGSLPVVLVGWLFRIPILIHESDSRPGLANRWAANFASRIAIGFASAEKYFPAKKTALIGNPGRPELVQFCLSANPQDKEQARALFKIASQKPVILILGGSQGASKINQMVLGVLPRLLEKYEIIHQCGASHYQAIKKMFPSIEQTVGYHLFGFLDEAHYRVAYLLADLVISRAGAGVISEIAVCGKPGLLIPLPGSAAEHQRANALLYAQTGGAVVLEQANLTPYLFLDQIDKILTRADLIEEMEKAAGRFGQPAAAQKIAQALLQLYETV